MEEEQKPKDFLEKEIKKEPLDEEYSEEVVKPRRRCSVCPQMIDKKLLTYTHWVEDAFIVVIKLILHGECTIEQARSFVQKVRKPEKKQRVRMCYIHLPEALNEIFKVLQIQKLEEIWSCSSESMNNMMVTVNAIHSKVSALNFCIILHKFAIRNRNILRMASIVHPEMRLENQQSQNLISNQNKNCSQDSWYPKKRCSVCAQLKPLNELRTFQSSKTKLIIMVGCLLRGDYTLEPAQSFMKSFRKTERDMCKIHISQAIDEIYKALDIKHYNELAKCSAEKMKNLMIIVNYLKPKLDSLNFEYEFVKFVIRHKKLVRMG